MANQEAIIKVRQTRSGIGQKKQHKATLSALGLGRIGRTVEHKATPSLVGMLRAVNHLIEVEGLDQ